MLPSSVEEGMPWPKGHSWGGASRARFNHPALASASAAPPYRRRGALRIAYGASAKGTPLIKYTQK